MIDLTNYAHQRGIVILNSQEYRIANRASVDVGVYGECILDYANSMMSIIDIFKNKEEYSEKDIKDIIEALEWNLKSMIDWCDDIKKAKEKMEKIFY